MIQDIYTSGAYLEKNPVWHADESPWKVREILRLLNRNGIKPDTIGEVGCGAGDVLRIFQQNMPETCEFWGYDISPQAFELCRNKENERLHFKLADFLQEDGPTFDLLLLMDVVEHVENCLSFLRDVKSKGEYKVIQLPIDLSVQSILFGHVAQYREQYGHIHYFTRELAIATLKEAGYEILDMFYTQEQLTPIGDPTSPPSWRRKLRSQLGKAYTGLLNVPGQISFAINQDFAVRVWGHWGRWRLLLLAK